MSQKTADWMDAREQFEARLHELGWFRVWATPEGIIITPEEIAAHPDKLDEIIDVKERSRQMAREHPEWMRKRYDP